MDLCPWNRLLSCRNHLWPPFASRPQFMNFMNVNTNWLNLKTAFWLLYPTALTGTWPRHVQNRSFSLWRSEAQVRVIHGCGFNYAYCNINPIIFMWIHAFTVSSSLELDHTALHCPFWWFKSDRSYKKIFSSRELAESRPRLSGFSFPTARHEETRYGI